MSRVCAGMCHTVFSKVIDCGVCCLHDFSLASYIRHFFTTFADEDQ